MLRDSDLRETLQWECARDSFFLEPKVMVMIPMYEPLEVTECKKCRKVIAEPKELIGMWKE